MQPAPPSPEAILEALGAKKLPDGPGKQIIETDCKDCHTFARISSAHHSPARWRTIVKEMQQKGADVEPGDRDTLLQYLADNFGVKHTAAKAPTQAPSGSPAPQR